MLGIVLSPSFYLYPFKKPPGFIICRFLLNKFPPLSLFAWFSIRSNGTLLPQLLLLSPFKSDSLSRVSPDPTLVIYCKIKILLFDTQFSVKSLPVKINIFFQVARIIFRQILCCRLFRRHWFVSRKIFNLLQVPISIWNLLELSRTSLSLLHRDSPQARAWTIASAWSSKQRSERSQLEPITHAHK